MILPADVCRCHDAGCPERQACQRWVYRDHPKGEMLAQCASLFPYDMPLDAHCPLRIPLGEVSA